MGLRPAAPIGAGTSLGASPNQADRPYRYQGQVTVGGETFGYATGGAGRGSMPYGDYPVNIGKGDIGGIGQRIGSVATVGGSSGTIQDPKFPGAPRVGIQIHPGSGRTLDQLYTQGCFGVPRAEWPRFKAALLREASSHPEGLNLSIGRDGIAQIHPRGQTIAQNPQGVGMGAVGAVGGASREQQATVAGAPTGRIEATRLREAFEQNPDFERRFVGTVTGEVGTVTGQRGLLQAESMRNRFLLRRETAERTSIRPASTGGYHAGEAVRNASEAEMRAWRESGTREQLLGGSNISRQLMGFEATGQASGGFALRREAAGIYARTAWPFGTGGQHEMYALERHDAAILARERERLFGRETEGKVAGAGVPTGKPESVFEKGAEPHPWMSEAPDRRFLDRAAATEVGKGKAALNVNIKTEKDESAAQKPSSKGLIREVHRNRQAAMQKAKEGPKEEASGADKSED